MYKRIMFLMLLCLALGAFLCCEPAQAKAQKTVTGQVNDYRFDYINLDWWDNFNDDNLKRYIVKAIESNHDLQIATIRTEEYKNLVKVSFGQELPMISIMPGYTRLRLPEMAGMSASTSNSFLVPVIASYEADIFLKNRDKTKAAKKEFEASKFEEKAIYISLSTSVATAYFNIVQLDTLINLQNEIVTIRGEIGDLTTQRHKHGLSCALDVMNAQKNYSAAQMVLADFMSQRELLLNQFAVLIGDNPANSKEYERTSLDKLAYKAQIPESISSDIIFNRPDVLKSEADLEKAKIDVRIARKDFLPTLPIMGIAGYNSSKLSHLFGSSSFIGAVNAGLSQAVFTGGIKMSTLKIKKLEYERLFENYKKVDLTAIQEVNDSLCAVKYSAQIAADSLKRYELEENTFALSGQKYKKGAISHLDLLQYKENLLLAQMNKSTTKAQQLTSYLTLYKAAGSRL